MRVRRVLWAAGVAVAVALPGGRSAERPAAAWATGAEGSGPSPFVSRARRGEVAVPSPDEVERMCGLLTSCDKLPIPSSLFPSDFQTCVKTMSEEMTSPTAVNFSLTMRECGLGARSCAGLQACALHGASPDECRGRGRLGVVGFCDVDGRAMTCWHDEVLAVRDCPRGGEQCIVVDGEATCTLGACSAQGGDGGKSRCSASGTHLLRCEKGKLASLDCAAFGLRCSIAADGAAGCATSGPSCGDGSKRCDGNVAIGCFNGHEVRIDCDGAGLVCTPSPGAVAVGACQAPVAPVGACNPDERATCDGSNIRYCRAGRARTYSCKSLGFRACDLGKNGVRCVL
jgi:hypothetical protein